MREDLRVGDVVLDLAQGRTMQIVAEFDGDAEQWTKEEGYDLLGNYGNSRFDPETSDRVFDCVYTSGVRSEPSKTYAFPESRLRRVEVEAAEEDLRRVQEEIISEYLIEFFTVMHRALEREGDSSIIDLAIQAAPSEDLVQEAHGVGEVAAKEAKNAQQTTLEGNEQ